jgi:putative heme iron utilization protein
MNPALEARHLLRYHRYGALSTLSKKLTGFPFGSITPYLTDQDGSLIILISALAEHTKNIHHDPRVSLITHNQSNPEIQMQGRVTVVGTAHRLDCPQPLLTRYLRYFPEAANLILLDFDFYRIQPVAIRHIGGIGKIHWIKIEDYFAASLAIPAEDEKHLLQHINTTQKDALHNIMLQYYGIQSNDIELISFDCDGLDIKCHEKLFRMNLDSALNNPKQLEKLNALNFLTPPS